MTAHTLQFTVRGSGEFPADMLRYDTCIPASEADSAKIAWRYGDAVPDGCGTIYKRDVVLTMQVPHKYAGGPTVRRWESFCWKVVSTRTDP